MADRRTLLLRLDFCLGRQRFPLALLWIGFHVEYIYTKGKNMLMSFRDVGLEPPPSLASHIAKNLHDMLFRQRNSPCATRQRLHHLVGIRNSSCAKRLRLHHLVGIPSASSPSSRRGTLGRTGLPKELAETARAIYTVPPVCQMRSDSKQPEQARKPEAQKSYRFPAPPAFAVS